MYATCSSAGWSQVDALASQSSYSPPWKEGRGRKAGRGREGGGGREGGREGGKEGMKGGRQGWREVGRKRKERNLLVFLEW